MKLLKALFWPDENMLKGFYFMVGFAVVIEALYMWRLTLYIALIVAAVYSAGSLFAWGMRSLRN